MDKKYLSFLQLVFSPLFASVCRTLTLTLTLTLTTVTASSYLMPLHPLILPMPDLLVDRDSVDEHGSTVNIRQLRGLFLLAYCGIRDLWDVGPGSERLRWCVT